MSQASRNGPLIVILVFLLTTAIIFAVYSYQDQLVFVDHQQKIAAQSTAGASENITGLLENMKKSLSFFMKGFEHLLLKLAKDPDDIETHAEIDRLLSEHYSNYYAFTIADSHGAVIYDDFGERVGDICRRDIQSFAKSGHQSEIYIHPGPGEYHFDLMMYWPVDGEKRVFFVSFKADAIAKLLRNTQIAGHQLMLLRKDIPELIEVTAQGSRAERTAETIHLTKEEQSRILHSQPIPDTRWLIADLPMKELFSDYRRLMWTQYISVMAVFTLAAVLMFRRIWREESIRRKAEAELKRSHEELEIRVEERTEDLQKSNEKLELEISERKKLARVVEQTENTVIVVGKDGFINYVNPVFEQKSKKMFSDVVGIDIRQIEGKFDQSVIDTVLKTGIYRAVWEMQNDEGRYFEEITVSLLREDNGEVTHFVVTGKDITDRLEAERRLEYLATHDALTGLGNRAQLRLSLQTTIETIGDHDRILAVLFLNLDRFKTVNDSLGHAAGDQVVKLVAGRLLEVVADNDVVFCLGGDHFAILMDRNEIQEIMATADVIVAKVAEPMFVDNNNIYSTASIGVSLYPFDNDIDVLLKHADTAMHRAKDAGGGRIEFYANEMGEIVNKRLSLESRLHNALANDEFILYYQPRVDLRTGEISGAEALLRWNNPDLGMVQPLDFISLLEETGQIEEVGEWVLLRACSDFQQLPKQLRLAVNLSPRQFQQINITDNIINIALSSSFELTRLDLEVTESILVKEAEAAADLLSALHNAGAQIAIDDFGTGYSSLSYLKKFPIDCLKVDRAFVRDLFNKGDDGYNLVAAIVSMAHSLRMTVVAEGIETEEQFNLINGLGVEEGQGYLFSAPIPFDKFVQLLSKQKEKKAFSVFDQSAGF